MVNAHLIEPKVLKGFRDSLPDLAIPRQRMIRTLEDVFSLFGFVPIDTPALEYSEILLGKGSAETDKQLYRFSDNGGRDVALRFDLTVPLARFIAAHVNELGTPFKRFHIAPVWRAEKPQRGRYREFIQCDFDIIGSKSHFADAEILSVVHTAFHALDIGHRIRINNRLILNGVLDHVGAKDRSASVLRAVDKLEKQSPEAVTKELTEEAQLDASQIDAIFRFVSLSAKPSTPELLFAELSDGFGSNALLQEGINQLSSILSAAHDLGIPEDAVGIDLSIARGLDYYTGLVFETVMLELPAIGSVCSGGRYDNLAALYSSRDLPGVGGSVGLDRILGAYEALDKVGESTSTAQVLVPLVDQASASYALQTANRLRNAGIAVEVYPEIAKLGNQLKYGGKKGVRLALIAGESEMLGSSFALKDLETGKQRDNLPLADVERIVKEALLYNAC